MLWDYGGKFLPIIMFCTLLYGSCLMNCCENLARMNANITCELVYPVQNNDINFDGFEPYLIYSQHITIFMIVFLFCK